MENQVNCFKIILFFSEYSNLLQLELSTLKHKNYINSSEFVLINHMIIILTMIN